MAQPPAPPDTRGLARRTVLPRSAGTPVTTVRHYYVISAPAAQFLGTMRDGDVLIVRLQGGRIKLKKPTIITNGEDYTFIVPVPPVKDTETSELSTMLQLLRTRVQSKVVSAEEMPDWLLVPR